MKYLDAIELSNSRPMFKGGLAIRPTIEKVFNESLKDIVSNDWALLIPNIIRQRDYQKYADTEKMNLKVSHVFVKINTVEEPNSDNFCSCYLVYDKDDKIANSKFVNEICVEPDHLYNSQKRFIESNENVIKNLNSMSDELFNYVSNYSEWLYKEKHEFLTWRSVPEVCESITSIANKKGINV